MFFAGILVDEFTVVTDLPTICIEVYELNWVGSNDILLGCCDIDPTTYLRKKVLDIPVQPLALKLHSENMNKLISIQGNLVMSFNMVESPSFVGLSGEEGQCFHFNDVPYQSKISDMKSLQPMHAVEVCILKMIRTDDWPLAVASISRVESSRVQSSIEDGNMNLPVIKPKKVRMIDIRSALKCAGYHRN